MLRLAIATGSMLLPWPLRRYVLRWCLGYDIARNTRIGFSLVACDRLIMEEGAVIGHFTVIKSIHHVVLRENARIGSLNWIYGIGLHDLKHFGNESDRRPELLLGRHAGITGRHLIDCSNMVSIGEFSIISGAGTQIITHAVDIRENRQKSSPVNIGRYCFVGAGCIVLKGSTLPDYSVLAANSTLRGKHLECYTIYSGVPAVPTVKIDADAAYFHRSIGYVP
jgi:acetyltransferase-like isoleucine patch superfamily enzyme